MSTKKQKTYINGSFIREKVFDWGTVVDLDINIEKFIEALGEHDDGKGYAHFQITRRREPTENGVTHSMSLNDYKYKKKEEDPFNGGDKVPF